MANTSETNIQEEYSQNPFHSVGRGKKTQINEYCQGKGKEAQCIWLCQRHGRTMFAQDVSPEFDEESLSLHLQKSSWLDGFLFYGNVGIRLIEIKFYSGSQQKQGFRVLWRPNSQSELVHDLEVSLRKEWDFEPLSCGVDIKGKRHEDGTECPNRICDEISNWICKVKERRKLARRLNELKWTPTFLDFYWRYGIRKEDMALLETAGLVWSYSALAEDRWTEIEEPFGKTIHALELIQGWHTMRLLYSTIAAAIADVLIVAMITVATKSLQSGLAAGSYAVGLQALFLAMLAMLGVVLA
ncbi:MAG: hypothetical protein Q9164_001365 [Protoblastenia rupestris]